MRSVSPTTENGVCPPPLVHQFRPCEVHVACRQKNTASNESEQALEMLSELQLPSFISEIFILALIASGVTVPLSQNELSDHTIAPPSSVCGGPPNTLWKVQQDSSYGCTRS